MECGSVALAVARHSPCASMSVLRCSAMGFSQASQEYCAVSGWPFSQRSRSNCIRQRKLIVPNGSPWLFPGDTPGQPVQEIRRFWKRIQFDADLPDVRIHDLRHSFASLLVSGGASLEMIGKLLGHSQMQTTQRYAHLMDSPLRAGVDAVAAAFRPRPKLVREAGAGKG